MAQTCAFDFADGRSFVGTGCDPLLDTPSGVRLWAWFTGLVIRTIFDSPQPLKTILRSP